jgi:hypothetical protein
LLKESLALVHGVEFPILRNEAVVELDIAALGSVLHVALKLFLVHASLVDHVPPDRSDGPV